MYLKKEESDPETRLRDLIMVSCLSIVKVEKVNLVNEVYRQILHQITSGSWQEGEKIASEHELSKLFAVSRVVIREALQRLRSERYIITKQGIGSFVKNPNNYDGLDVQINLSEGIFEQMILFRQAIEYASVKLSVDNGTEEDYERLFQCVSKMQESREDVEAFSRADFDFHYAVVLCAHNGFFEQAMLANKKLITQVLKEMNSIPQSQSFAVDTHYKIAELVRSRNAKAVLEEYESMTSYNVVRLEKFYGERNI